MALLTLRPGLPTSINLLKKISPRHGPQQSWWRWLLTDPVFPGDSGLCDVSNLKSPLQGPTQDWDSQWGQTTSQVQGFSLGYSGWHAKLFHKKWYPPGCRDDSGWSQQVKTPAAQTWWSDFHPQNPQWKEGTYSQIGPLTCMRTHTKTHTHTETCTLK